MPDFQDKIALVTGASRGIGFSTAIELAKSGAHVIALARTVGGLEELDDEIQKVGGSATLIPQDLMDLEAIDQIGAAIAERWGKLDILFANAAMAGPKSPISHIDAKTFEKVFHLNVTATWRLIKSVEPVLAKADNAKAAIVSCAEANTCPAFSSVYSASKAAVESLARVWSEEVKSRGMCVNCVDPGPTRTALRAQGMPGEDPETLPLTSDVATEIVPIFSSDRSETGMLFDVRQKKFLNFQLPG